MATLTPRAASAADAVNTTLFGNLAIEGYDAVAYFTDGEAVKGRADYTLEWQGANWRFASGDHRDLFEADPTRYAPQYGGYCAFAVAKGKMVGIDPEAWQIVDDKLYLQYSKKVQKQWQEDIPGFITKADENWPKLIAKE
ncbi:MAG: YHS domain-containing protein [Thermoanaerobaculia bacterium]|nr:YHS domain-containing protein [Thermoanaerobaculia bacterium]